MDKIFTIIHNESIEELLKLLQTGININIQDKEKKTLLIHAVINNKLEMVRLLISKGIDLNIQDSLGYTALHYAVQNYNIDAVELLLSNKARVDVQDKCGNTPLFRAVFNSRGRGEVIKLLLANGANRNLTNNYGISPLNLANTISNYGINKFFL